MEKMTYSKYDLIKAILASNLEEDVKEDIVNSLINCYQPQPVYYSGLTTNCDYKDSLTSFLRETNNNTTCYD